MLFPPSSVFPRFPLSLVFSRNVCLAAAEWKASKRHWLAQTSGSLVSYHLSPLPYPPSCLTFSSRVRRSGLNARENISAYVSSIRGRISPCSPDFCTFFQDARPSLPTGRLLSLSDLDVRRAYGLWPWNFPSPCSLPRMIFVHYCFSIYLLYDFSNKRYYECDTINFNFNTSRLVMHCLLCCSSRA